MSSNSVKSVDLNMIFCRTDHIPLYPNTYNQSGIHLMIVNIPDSSDWSWYFLAKILLIA